MKTIKEQLIKYIDMQFARWNNVLVRQEEDEYKITITVHIKLSDGLFPVLGWADEMRRYVSELYDVSVDVYDIRCMLNLLHENCVVVLDLWLAVTDVTPEQDECHLTGSG